MKVQLELPLNYLFEMLRETLNYNHNLKILYIFSNIHSCRSINRVLGAVEIQFTLI